jgi:hypothetical protein
MRTPRRISIGLALLLLATQAQAMRWYSPSTGRWLSRDPIGEPGFALLNLNKQQSNSSGDSNEPQELSTRQRVAEHNLYGFVLNDPQNRFDPLGLISFSDCPPSKQADIQAAWDSMCSMVNDPKFQCCVDPSRTTFFQLLKRRCSWGNVRFVCKTGDAQSPCAWSIPSLGIGRGRIWIYDNAWDTTRCGQLKCTLAHEMAHILAGRPFEGGIVQKADDCCEQH